MDSMTRRSGTAAAPPVAARPGHKPGAASASASGTLDRSLACVGEARRALERFLRRCRIGPSCEFDILVAVGEAVSNGIRHGRGERIRWAAAAGDGCIEVWVEYASARFVTMPRLPEDNANSDCGRGLLLMHSLMDDTRFEFRGGMVRVLMMKQIK